MRDAARGVAFTLGTTWRVARLPFVVTVLLTVVLALVPAVQVFVTASLIERLDGQASARDVVLPVLAVAAIIGLVGPVQSALNVVRQAADDVSAATITAALARRAAATTPRELADPEVVAELERHNEAVWRVVQAIPTLSFWAVQHVISTIAVIAAVAVFSPLAALLTALALIPSLLGGQWMSKRMEQFWDRVGKLFARERYLTSLLMRQRPALELSALGAGTTIAERATAQWYRYIDARRTMRTSQLRVDWVTGLTSAVCVLAALFALLDGTNFTAVAVAGIAGVVSAAGSVAAAGSDIGSLLSYGPQGARLRDFLAGRTDHPAPAQRIERVDALGASGLEHRYPGRRDPALMDVAFEARRGEVIALVGANGAGKTTAVRALLGLLDPDAGTIDVDGVSPSDVDPRVWLARFGVLVQEYERYELTVRENLLLGALGREVGDDELWAALDLAGLSVAVRAMPEQLDTQLGEQWEGTQLSGGQWQRLALARVAVRDAPVWVLDEPTSAVDAESEEQIIARLVREGGERITVLVSHRAWTLRQVDRIYVLDEGRVVEHGSYGELSARQGRFAELFRNQLDQSI